MRTKVTLALLFLNAAVFFFIYYLRHNLQPGSDAADAGRLVLPAEAMDIREIEITVGPELTRLVRRGEQWSLSSPIEWPANPHAVSHMLTELQSLRHETSFTVESLAKIDATLATYGLESPAMTVTLGAAPAAPGEPPARYTLRLGNSTSVDNRLYLLSHDARRIHVVSRSLAESLAQPLDQLRASALFTIPDFEVRTFTIQPSAAVSARTRIRRDASRWAMENPVQTRANTAAVRSTLAALGGLRIENFISQPLSPELNPSSATSLRITLEGNNRSETLLLGAPVPREGGLPPRAWYAQFEWKVEGERKSAVFTVALQPTLLETLRNAQERLRETRILDLDTASVTSLVLRAPDQPDLSLQRLEAANAGESPRWQLVRRTGDAAPLTLPADSDAVSALLQRLSLLNATRFVTDAPGSSDLEAWGFNRPERTLVLQAGPSTPPLTLELGLAADHAGAAYARLDTARFVYEVDAAILAATLPDPRLWRDRRVQELPAGASISALRITELQGGATLAEHRFATDGSEPATAIPPLTLKAWNTLAASLRSLRARNFVADHHADTFVTSTGEHRWRHRLSIEIALKAGSGEQTRTQTLDLSERLGGSQLVAGSAELDLIFELEQPAVDALWTLLYADRDPGIPPPPVPASAPSTAPAPAPADGAPSPTETQPAP